MEMIMTAMRRDVNDGGYVCMYTVHIHERERRRVRA